MKLTGTQKPKSFNYSMDRNPLTMITIPEVKRMLAMDSKDLSTKDYVCEDNILTAYVLLNTWLLQVNDLDARLAYDLHYDLRMRGIVPVIRDCSNAADQIISQCCPTYLPVSAIWQDDIWTSPDRLKELLQALRYPKRYSPCNADLLQSQSLFDFVEHERYVKGLNIGVIAYERQADGPHVTRYMSRYIITLLKEILSTIKYTGESDGAFTPGADRFGQKTLVNKVYSCEYDFPTFQGSGATLGRCGRAIIDTEIQGVPKNYKAYRIIGKEHPYTVYHMTGIRKDLIDNLDHEECVAGLTFNWADIIHLEHQGYNQVGAYLGSDSLSIATIDMSKASDTIPASLAREIFPAALVRDIDRYRSPYCQIDGKMYRTQMFLTSGTPLTQIMESFFFAACELAAIILHNLFTGDTISSEHVLVFGDDGELPDECVETLFSIYDSLGQIYNPDKSFWSRGTWTYRESCGHEYLNGERVDSHYFTRKTLSLKDRANTEAVLIDMQHKFYNQWKCERWLRDLVLLLHPDMTFSLPGSECSDLWGVGSQLRYRSLPAGEFQGYGSKRSLRSYKSDQVTEVHYVLTTVSSPDREAFLGTYRESPSVLQLQVAYDFFCYEEFLKHGPRYDSELDRLLGVSTARVPFNKAQRRLSTVWVLR